MRRSAGPAALLTLLLAPALAAAGPIGVNVLLASQMVEPNPSLRNSAVATSRLR